MSSFLRFHKLSRGVLHIPNVRNHGGLAQAAVSESAENTRIVEKMFSTDKTKTETISVPKMPPIIKSWIHEDWAALDDDGPAMIESFKSNTAFSEFSHARSVFKDHLKGTFATLSAWNVGTPERRAGLFHTGYSGDLFQFCFWDASSEVHRAELRDIVGDEAERLTWLFGTVNRGSIANLSNVIDPTKLETPKDLPDDLASKLTIEHRLQGCIDITSHDASRLLVITLADYLDQLVEINGWRDHHQVEAPLSLYPGDGRPGLALYWISSIFKSIRPQLLLGGSSLPPLFNDCSSTLSYGDERDCRDAYWEVVCGESSKTLGDIEQEKLLKSAISRNPFVAEPHLLLSQIAFRRGQYDDCIVHGSKALELMYTLCTAWDKRLPYSQWVAYTRLLLLRAGRKRMGLTSMPEMNTPTNLVGKLPLVSLRELCSEMQ